MNTTKRIAIRHLLINKENKIGIKFYPDKVIQALIKQLPGVKWSNKYGMAYISNTPNNLSHIYNSFKGVAWVDGKYFYRNKPLKKTVVKANLISINTFRLRKLPAGYRSCPPEYLQKLELKKYSINDLCKRSCGFQDTCLSIYHYTLYKDTNFKFSPKPQLRLHFVTCWLLLISLFFKF